MYVEFHIYPGFFPGGISYIVVWWRMGGERPSRKHQSYQTGMGCGVGLEFRNAKEART